jgi:hypothetical protein
MPVHNLSPGFYCVDHTNGQVVAGPFGSRKHISQDEVPCCVLEVVGPPGSTVPWCVEPITGPSELVEAVPLQPYRRSYREKVADGPGNGFEREDRDITAHHSEVVPDAEPTDEAAV